MNRNTEQLRQISNQKPLILVPSHININNNKISSEHSLTSQNRPPFLSHVYIDQKINSLNNKYNYLRPYLSKGSRGSLPYTLNIPESIPEVPASPRRHSISFNQVDNHTQIPSSYHQRSTSSLLDDVIIEPVEFERCLSPLRACDLAAPCSNTFEEVLKTLEQNNRNDRYGKNEFIG
ncbi:hypothetical protein EWB00_009493 [Schistosoma japonicum]|uniref:Uncharacterized protein n=1 Tax=Schistosoma japonicum TaxID=6182 RepID=A0A4Z2DRB4_SCHJA|nr:hypothetical protein EWB00_009493 [Schistosoma japonicum]